MICLLVKENHLKKDLNPNKMIYTKEEFKQRYDNNE